VSKTALKQLPLLAASRTLTSLQSNPHPNPTLLPNQPPQPNQPNQIKLTPHQHPLKQRFFRHAKDSAYIKKRLLEGLPSLPQRHSEIMRGAGAAATRAMDNEARAAASQVLYINDLASWDFACVVPPESGEWGGLNWRVGALGC